MNQIREECAMRVSIGILLFLTVVNIGLGQEVSPESKTKLRIDKLVIEANRLPNGDRERIAHSFEHRIYCQGELEPRIETAFRDLGYFYARADEPKLSSVSETQGAKDVNVSVRVDQGVQYRLGEIRFEKTSLFPSDRMRKLFAVQTGDLFNYTRIGEGLEQLRNLYATEGYVDLVANPVTRFDESHRTIDLYIDLDEGKSYDFGRLLLDGTEPHAGAGKALLESWKTLQGRRYNPLLLKRWLVENTSDWPSAPTLDRTVATEDPELHVVNVKLLLP
jgi:outer membrane translocation and assembly module TamA